MRQRSEGANARVGAAAVCGACMRQGSWWSCAGVATLLAMASAGGLGWSQTPAAPAKPTPAKPTPAKATPAKAAPAKAAPATPPAQDRRDTRQYTSAEIAQRPYNGVFTAPIFPSSPKVQKQFTVEYIYNYAQSTYTPAVALPVVARAAAKFSTPEDALIAFYSAVRTADYDFWLSCWDAPSRKALEEQTKQRPEGKESWLKIFRSAANKKMVLQDRIDTVNYVILDASIEGGTPAGAARDVETLVLESGSWKVSNQFSNDGLLSNLPLDRDGKGKVVKQFEVAPRSELVGARALTGKAQERFYAMHDRTGSVRETVE